MPFPSKRLIASGAAAAVVAAVLSGTITHHGDRGPRSFLFPFESAAQAQNSAPAAQVTSEKYFKNVTVLKGIPVDEFMGTMGLFSAALSMCCGDCHIGAGTDNPDWAADTGDPLKSPRKVIARRMAAMVKKINQENFGGGNAVTCWTCHRGNGSPAVTASMDVVYGEPLSFAADVLKEAPTSAGAGNLDQIFDKYINALGGADKLTALKSFTARGTSHLYDEARNDPAEIVGKAPNQVATFVHQRGGDLARTSDGHQAWVMLPLTVVKKYPLNATALDGGRLDAQMFFPAGIKGFFEKWKVSFPTTIDGHDVYTVQGSNPDGFVATFYFDKQTGLMTRMIRYAKSAVGRVPTQIDYSDYRPVAGVMMPHKFIYAWISGREEYNIDEYTPNTPVEAAKFGEPMQRAAK